MYYVLCHANLSAHLKATMNVHLLRFGVENNRSFRDYTEVSFVATSQTDEPHFTIPSKIEKAGLLPVVGVYGANAAGKSNVLEALLEMRRHVLFNLSLDAESKIPRQPFRRDPDATSAPTRFDCDLSIDGIRHHYGFVFVADHFVEEWYYAWPKGRQQVLFERDVNAEETWYFGSAMRGEKTALSRTIQPNNLFLSLGAKAGNPTLQPIFKALTTGIRSESRIELGSVPLFTSGAPILDEANHDRVVQALKAADLGVVDYSMKAVPKEVIEQLKRDLSEEDKRAVAQALSNTFELTLKRRSDDGVEWELPSQFESRGTHIFLRRINDMLGKGTGVLVIDELELGLHPELVAALLALYTSEAHNKGVQLFFSTHALNLLRGLRRDEVVLVEKDGNGASSVFSASDLRELRKRDDLRTVYEEGMVGATPNLGDLSVLWERGESDA